MVIDWVLMLLAVVIPLISAVIVLRGSANLSERHHAHHDTYTVAATLLWGIVSAMLFMGALGVLVGWLCSLGALTANTVVVMAFFDGFLVTLFASLILLRRYKIMTFENYMRVTPLIGRTVTIIYSDITAMEWSSSLLLPGTHNIRVHAGNRNGALLWAALDLDQILIRVNRFDSLESLRSK